MEDRARIPVKPPVANPIPSYWHNPLSPLANIDDRETSRLMEPYDYVIVGSGISGTMIAYNLLKANANARVLMLEAREICSGATGRNGGHTKAASYRTYVQHVRELGKEEALQITRLEYANIIETHELARHLGIECENQICDTLDFIYDQATFETGKEAIERLRADATGDEREKGKMAWYQIDEMTKELAQSLCVGSKNSNPMLPKEEKLVGVIRYLAGRLHAYRFATGVLKECVKRGLQIRTNTPVHSIRPHTEKSHIWEICTQSDVVQAHNVILATNGYTAYLLNSLQGIIVPLRGQITAQRPGTESKLPSPLPTTASFIYRNGYEYLIPRPIANGEQHLVIGGGLGRLRRAGASEYGTTDDSLLDSHISNYLRGCLKGYFGVETWGEVREEDSSRRIAQEWTGIMGATADGRPLVGQVPGSKGMWISAGFNGHGMVLGLKCAEALVGMMGSSTDDTTETTRKKPEWFPASFLVTEERLNKSKFGGRADLQDSHAE